MHEFDIVLYGATGFTGQQAVKYFLQNAPKGIRWGIAGRDRAKLERLEAGVPTIVVDSAEQTAIDAMVRGTRIILSTAGPFQLYSDAVVDSCVRFGSHYLDISGETLWAGSLIERFHDRATASGIRIIPSCGFDSVPSDLGAIWVNQLIGGAAEVKAYYELKGGQPNGGTVATGFHVASSNTRNQLRDPFLLVPGMNRGPRPVEMDPTKAHYDSDVRAWVTPFIMGPINTRVVRRSCALVGLAFSYQEYAKSSGVLQAHVSNGLGKFLQWSLESPRMRKAMQRIAPSPGTGPPEKVRDEGWFRCEFFARGSEGRVARAMVSGEGDPANRVTVKCLCESGFALACEAEHLPDRVGVLTPSSGLGDPLLKRLMAKGIKFSAIPT